MYGRVADEAGRHDSVPQPVGCKNLTYYGNTLSGDSFSIQTDSETGVSSLSGINTDFPNELANASGKMLLLTDTQGDKKRVTISIAYDTSLVLTTTENEEDFVSAEITVPQICFNTDYGMYCSLCPEAIPSSDDNSLCAVQDENNNNGQNGNGR